MNRDTAYVAAEKRTINSGATSVRVAANVRRLRIARGLSTYDVVRKLDAAGWPMQPTAITRIESGNRNVSVDDLVALAAVLGVSPGTLLMPETQAPLAPLHAPAEILPGLVVSLGAAWAWTVGEAPLELGTLRDEAQFALVNRPHRFALLSRTGSPVTDDLGAVARAVTTAMEHKTSPWQLRTMFEQALTSALNAHGDEPARAWDDYMGDGDGQS